SRLPEYTSLLSDINTGRSGRTLLLRREGLARDVGVPIGERPVRIVLPRPDMQGIERRKTETIGCREQVKKLSHELRRPRVLLIPIVCENQEVDAGHLQASARDRFVDDDLRLGGVQYAAAHNRPVDIVQTHGADLVAGDAAELQGITLRLSDSHVVEA